jgi:hypothetical protein
VLVATFLGTLELVLDRGKINPSEWSGCFSNYEQRSRNKIV